MSTTAEIPDLTTEDMKAIFENMDVYLNQILLEAFLDGVYTGILAIALWSIFSPKRFQAERRKTMMVLATISLYILETITLSVHWWLVNYAFIKSGQNFWDVFLGLQHMGSSFLQLLLPLVVEICGMTATIIADTIIIWRCWIVWDRRWLMVLLPIFCTLITTAATAMYLYHRVNDVVSLHAITSHNPYTIWIILSLSFALSTTVVSTVLIIYRIIKVVIRTERGKAGFRSYRGAVEILVESAFLYSFGLLLHVIFIARGTLTTQYLDAIASVGRGIAPTFVLGQVTAGQARPDDTWSESVASSLRFGGHSGDQGGCYSGDSIEEEYGVSSRDHHQENVDEESVAGSPGEQSQLGTDLV
ncbi:hypothetical protein ARMGADRAFT_1090215 [Armillaria gallica]|uniref:Family A G protein-coupled receptor-like protein n=1 Tax=Armillaria gallica TaxID=47427 RepID=A0A2H3CHG4_ARMGA|nr:hypothetical protein ARMGADRAFT_1090215 [Armillaria gallica]